jgi:hypothetical protein
MKTPEEKKKYNEYMKQYRLANKEKFLLKEKEYREQNKDKVKKVKQNNYVKNKTKILAKQKEYVKNNPRNRKEYFKQYNKDYKAKLKTDPIEKLRKQIANYIRVALKKGSFVKKCRTVEILGCDIETFKLHLESQFEGWMTWQNKGLYNGTPNFGWDIDHIKPLSSAVNETDIIKLNHYTNLRPLCSYVNRYVKRDK